MAVPRFRPEVVTAVRQRRGWTIADLGRRLDSALAANGVTRPPIEAGDLERRQTAARDRVSKWERGVETPSPRFASLLARELGVDPTELYDVDPRSLSFTEVRYMRGWTLQLLSEAVGVSYTMLRRTIAGERPMSPDLTARLVEALDLNRTELRAALEQER